MARHGAARTIAGLLLLGYGLLIVTGVLPHDALLAGLVALALGLALLALPLLRERTDSTRPILAQPTAPARRRPTLAVMSLGLVATGGVVAYNAWRGSDLSLPEWGLLLYGLGLIAASFDLHRRLAGVEVGQLVAWSFPLLLAPLSLFALDAILASRTPAPAEPIIAALLVKPLALALGLLGDHAIVLGNSIILPTHRGALSLGVGLVCAGLYPMVLFAGVLAMHGSRERLPPRRFALYLGLGLLGLYAANLLRLLVLAKVGQAWGGQALQEAHANLGWILFVGFMLLFWGVVLRRLEGRRPAAPRSNP